MKWCHLDCRATFSLILHHAGTNQVASDKLHRHADIQTVTNTSSQVISAAKREAVQVVAEWFLSL
jgi:hypothetical protein